MGNAERVIQHHLLAPCSRSSVISQPSNPVFFLVRAPSLGLSEPYAKPSYLPNSHSARTTEEEHQSACDSYLTDMVSLTLLGGLTIFGSVGRSATVSLATDFIHPTLALSSYMHSQDPSSLPMSIVFRQPTRARGKNAPNRMLELKPFTKHMTCTCTLIVRSSIHASI